MNSTGMTGRWNPCYGRVAFDTPAIAQRTCQRMTATFPQRRYIAWECDRCHRWHIDDQPREETA